MARIPNTTNASSVWQTIDLYRGELGEVWPRPPISWGDRRLESGNYFGNSYSGDCYYTTISSGSGGFTSFGNNNNQGQRYNRGCASDATYVEFDSGYWNGNRNDIARYTVATTGNASAWGNMAQSAYGTANGSTGDMQRRYLGAGGSGGSCVFINYANMASSSGASSWGASLTRCRSHFNVTDHDSIMEFHNGNQWNNGDKNRVNPMSAGQAVSSSGYVTRPNGGTRNSGAVTVNNSSFAMTVGGGSNAPYGGQSYSYWNIGSTGFATNVTNIASSNDYISDGAGAYNGSRVEMSTYNDGYNNSDDLWYITFGSGGTALTLKTASSGWQVRYTASRSGT